MCHLVLLLVPRLERVRMYSGIRNGTVLQADIKTSGRLAADNTVNVQVTVTNSGACEGDEVVQLYLKDEA